MTERDRDLARRFTWAEGQQRKDQHRPNEEKKDWITTRCIHCKYKIQYIPKEGWSGELKCPECGKDFKVSRLDDFTREETRT